jgi:excisionase family DNA binding protein
MNFIDQLLYSRRDAARVLSLSVRSIDKLISKGQLSTVQVGTRRLLPRSELERIASQGVAGPLAGQ